MAGPFPRSAYGRFYQVDLRFTEWRFISAHNDKGGLNMCGQQSEEVFCGSPGQSGQLSLKSPRRSGQASGLLRSSVNAVGMIGRSILNSIGAFGRLDAPRFALGLALLASLAVAVPAFADDPVDYASMIAYANLGVSVGTLFGIVITALGGMLLPMIVFSIAMCGIYFLWSFVKGKAYGNA